MAVVFRILGPLEIAHGDQTVQIRGARQRAVLGVLLIHANRVVSADQLLEDVWGSPPPSSGTAALQMRVTELRRSLPADPDGGGPALATQPSGYVLRVGPDDVDAHRFERLLAQGVAHRDEGDPAAAAAALTAAGALWRGPALADFAYEPFAQAEIARLEELRLTAEEERIEAELALGRHAALVADLEGLVAAQPLRERLRSQLMLALYRCGRQADALAAYREARRFLSRELGVEPGPALQELHRRVLRQAPDLEPPRVGPPSPAAAEPPAPSLGGQVRKPVTVACTTLRVDDPAGDIDPERTSRALARCMSAVARGLAEHGAQVQRLPGIVLGSFGLPEVREDDALRAVRAAVAVHERLVAHRSEIEHELALRVVAASGVATGVVLAPDGAPDEMLTTGEPARAALALAADAGADEVLVTEGTAQLVRHAAMLTRRVRTARPSAWLVTDLAAERRGHAVRRDAPLVGRRHEMDVLSSALDRAVAERAVRTCTVLGPAGVGKSRLVQEFAGLVGARAAVLTGQCVPYGEVAAYWPLRQVVEQAAAGRPLVEVMSGSEHADLVAQLVGAAVGFQDSATGGDVYWAVGRLLQARARQRPVVVVLEDLHWAAPTMLALVEFLAGSKLPAPVLLLCLARPELLRERPGWRELAGSSVLELPALDARESDVLLRHLAEPGTVPAGTRETVARAAEGNPLFLEQLLATLTEQPGLDLATDLPPTVAALLAARLDRLGPGERAVLERAAVVGRTFHQDAVAALLPLPARATVSRHLAALVGRDLVTADVRHDAGATHMFRHGLIHAAATRSTPTGTRAELHEALAAWLDRGADAPDEVVGHHLERAWLSRVALGRRDEHTGELARLAARRLSRAGERAHCRGDMPMAAALLDRARRLPSGDDVSLTVLPGLGYALFEIGELRRAQEVLTEAVRRADQAGAEGIRWQAAVTLAHLRMYLDPSAVEVAELLGTAASAVEALERMGDEVGLARALMLRSDLDFMSGHAAMAQAAVERGLVCAHRAGHPREEAWCRGQLGFALIGGPVPADQGRDRCLRMLDETRADAVARANLLPFLAVHEAMRGEFTAARQHAAEGRAATRDLGLRWQDGIHTLLSSYVELFAGDPSAAEDQVRAAAASFDEMGDRWFACTAAVDLPRSLYEQGRYEQAHAAVDGLAGPGLVDVEWRIKSAGVPALLAARDGRFDEAEDMVRRGVAVAEGSDCLLWHADVTADLAEVLALRGHRRAAVEALAGSLRLYARKGHLVGARRARDRLAALRPVRATGRGPGTAPPAAGGTGARPPVPGPRRPGTLRGTGSSD